MDNNGSLAGYGYKNLRKYHPASSREFKKIGEIVEKSGKIV